jgi:hypothetical protein
MLRKFSFALAMAALLSLPAPTFAASTHAKRHAIYHWHGYGFLPGYHQPPSLGVPSYHQPAAQDVPSYTPYYWYGDGQYYYGEPRFLHGRWNGGSFGPCWTSTPIGLMWNCG